MAHGDRLRVGILGYGLDRPATGIARYTIELANALLSFRPDIEPILLRPFEGTVPGIGPLEEIRLRTARLLPGLMSLGPIELGLVARKHGLNIIHDPAGVAPFAMTRGLGNCRTMTTIHDMVPFLFPETHLRLTNVLFHRYLPITLRFADRIVTVSDSSASDIARYYPRHASKVTRIHGGVSKHFHPRPAPEVERVARHYGLPQTYALAVGAVQPRKNLSSLLTAFATARTAGYDGGLVLVGPKAWRSGSILRQVSELQLSDSTMFTGHVDDSDLPAVYSGADCFVFPSLYEGFGLPLLEAMACGTPVIASNVASIPEVAGDAAMLVDPLDTEGIASAFLRLRDDTQLRASMIQKGTARARRFSWETAAYEHAELYWAVARQSGSTQ
jgi:glycosyltransferase involved in cell wall biosynthesis